MAVDIGAEAINRDSTFTYGNTYVLKEHPSTVSDVIISIDIWAQQNIAGLVVGTFYLTGENILKCRDSEAIAGTITAGSKVNKAVSLAVEIGDYIGAYWTAGVLERSVSGYAGYYIFEGQSIDPDDEETYYNIANSTASLGGYIAAAAAGRSFGFIFG